MNSKMRTGRAMILLMIILFLSDNICAQDAYIHRLGMEGRAGYIFPTSSFLRGENDMRKIMRSACSAHLKYSFRLPPGTAADRIYGSSYQGIGLGYFDFGNRREMGTPVALYAFQGARIAGITPRLSLNYEWGFGASFGWKPYDNLFGGFTRNRIWSQRSSRIKHLSGRRTKNMDRHGRRRHQQV